MKPCDASDDCMHHVCGICDRIIRPMNQKAVDHPGALSGMVKARRCYTHRHMRVTEKPHDPALEYNLRTLESFMARIRGKSRVRT